MAIKFNKGEASEYLMRLVTEVRDDATSTEWIEYISELSKLCDEGNASTHIAFIGVELLAKSLDPDVDLYFIKPTKAPQDKEAHSYSARSLCHGVLVPLATEYDIDLGVSGAEPLNNQPYFRMNFLDDGTAVHTSSRKAWDYMLELIRRLETMDQSQAEAALRAFISVRKNSSTEYVDVAVTDSLYSIQLVDAIEKLIAAKSENGKRAQAAAAGVMDAVYGENRVDTGSGKINDPSRKRPGDVCILSPDLKGTYEKTFEVKDKPVNEADIMRFIRNGMSNYTVSDFGYLALSQNQLLLDEDKIITWAEQRGACVSIFYNWRQLIMSAVFWSTSPSEGFIKEMAARIDARLREIEASPEAVELWGELVGV